MDTQNYGFQFHDIQIQNNTFCKKAKTDSGKTKIQNETLFYLYLLQTSIPFPMPKLLRYSADEIVLEYIPSSVLTNEITDENQDIYLSKIFNHLSTIHSIRLPISSDILQRDLYIEICQKPLDRFNEYDWSTDPLYTSIHSVNHVPIRNIHHYIAKLHSRLRDLLQNRQEYQLIHGDTHLGNILVNNDDQDLYFIDPRGKFGDTLLFGLCEYDYAKLMFGLSGYSRYDQMVVESVNIKENNLQIDFIETYETVFSQEHRPLFDPITRYLCLSIWLANNSCFTDIHKKLTSLMIAYYYCEKYA